MRKFSLPNTSATTPRWESTTRKRWGRILLVDDYEDARATVREALEAVGHVVLEAGNGQEALNVLVSRPHERVSLIIADLQMPVMDGWRLIELLNCYVKLSTVPVIVVTSATDPHLERITHPAVRGCLRAPYELKDLVDLVEACLNPGPQQGARQGASRQGPGSSGP
jgi:CheY-like chemotaxis protein